MSIACFISPARVYHVRACRACVRRVSVGSTLARIALTAFYRAAREMFDDGSFASAENAISYAEFNGMFRES